MEKNTVKILLATALIAVGASAVSAQGRGGPQMSFEELDVDGSGEITLEDLTALRDNRFADLDSNGDGSITLDEFTASHMARAAERATAMFEQLDVDGDGVLSRDVVDRERRGDRVGRMIERFDADNSGGVSAEEYEEARAMFREHRKGGDRDHGQRRN